MLHMSREKKYKLTRRALCTCFGILFLLALSLFSTTRQLRRITTYRTSEDSSNPVGLVPAFMLMDPAQSNTIDCGCPDTCDASALAKKNTGLPFSCRERIEYLMTRYGSPESKACTVAVQQSACGNECSPDHCLSSTASAFGQNVSTTTREPNTFFRTLADTLWFFRKYLEWFLTKVTSDSKKNKIRAYDQIGLPPIKILEKALPIWVKEYVTWHSKMRAAFPDREILEHPDAPKVLIIVCTGQCGGINDRLKHLQSFLHDRQPDQQGFDAQVV